MIGEEEQWSSTGDGDDGVDDREHQDSKDEGRSRARQPTSIKFYFNID